MLGGVLMSQIGTENAFSQKHVRHFGKSSLVLLELYNITDKFCVKESDYPENPTTAFILEG